MADIIRLTEDWVSVSGTGTFRQATSNALDVSKYDILDFFVATGIDASGSLTFTLSLETGISLLSPTTWSEIAASQTHINTDRVTTTAVMSTLTGGFHRYVRWKVVVSGNVTVARFYVEGVGRSYH